MGNQFYILGARNSFSHFKTIVDFFKILFDILKKNHHFVRAELFYMAAYEIEIILNRQLADCLSIPVFITDTNGNLIFYNEPAEVILGKRFEDTGEMPVEQWSADFKPVDEKGQMLPPDELPLVKTLRDATPYHKCFGIISMEGKIQKISVTSYPIIGRTGKMLGAVAIFWKSTDE